MNNVVRSRYDFHQTAANIGKMGAYYTDPAHCADIGKMLHFSETEETICLEPSVGDGVAIETVTGNGKNPNIKLFGVELNDTVAAQTAQKSAFEHVLHGDFLNDVIISNRVFSFCFANPPYMDSDRMENYSGPERLEHKFLDKISNYVKVDGILVWIVPYRFFTEPSQLSFWMSRYETLKIFKFRESEFKKWKQVVVIGKRRAGTKGILRQDRDAFLETLSLDKIQSLPSTFSDDECIDVPPSGMSNLKVFQSKSFKPNEAMEFLRTTPDAVRELNKTVGKTLAVESYVSDITLNPPMELKDSTVALCVCCGVGSGIAGPQGQRHLQRGHVESVKEVTVEQNGRFQKTIERTRSKININIIEQNGDITHLV